MVAAVIHLLLILGGGGVVGVNCGGRVGLGFGGLTLDPKTAGDNSFTNLLFLNVTGLSTRPFWSFYPLKDKICPFVL